MKREAEGMSGHLDELEPDMIGTPFLAEGRKIRNAKVSVGWCAEISGTYWNGFIGLAFQLGDADMIAKAEKWARGALDAQEEDGYLGAYPEDQNRLADYNAWGTNWALRALLQYYEVTGRSHVLDACHRALLWFVENWKDSKTDYVGSTLIESMIYVYHRTGDPKLLEWSEQYLAWLEEHSERPNRVSDFLSARLDYNAMHAVAYGETMILPGIVYGASGDRRLLDASVNAIRKVIDKCLQRNGAPSTNLEYLSPRGANCETEYCNFATFSRSFQHALCLTGDAAYGDMIEKIVFNGSEGAKKKDGRGIAYMTSPNQVFATCESSIYGPSSNVEVFAPCYKVACCPAQSVRVLPEYLRSTCMVDAESNIYFVCYGPSTVRLPLEDGTDAEIEQITDYPFSEDVKFVFHLRGTWHKSISFRIPRWCESARIAVNGQVLPQVPEAGSFFELEREWNDRDVVSITLPMSVDVVRVDDSDYTNRQPIAIERGPLLFSLPIREKWTEFPGDPITPAPEEWPWFIVKPDVESYEEIHWDYVVDGSLLEDQSQIKVVCSPDSQSYPWTEAPVKIRIPARKHKLAYPPRSTVKTIEMYGTIKAEDLAGEIEQIELVPYGCANLRISYFRVIG